MSDASKMSQSQPRGQEQMMECSTNCPCSCSTMLKVYVQVLCTGIYFLVYSEKSRTYLYYDILCVAGFFRRSDRRTTYIRAGVIRAFCEDTLYLARPRERFYTIMVRPSYGVAVASFKVALSPFGTLNLRVAPACLRLAMDIRRRHHVRFHYFPFHQIGTLHRPINVKIIIGQYVFVSPKIGTLQGSLH
jgi:hypothetical protein